MEWVFYTRTPYLYECGVLHRLLLLRFFHNPPHGKRNNSTLSFYRYNSILELDGYGGFMNYTIKNLMYACLGENRDEFYFCTLYGENGSKIPVTFSENEQGISAFSTKNNTLYSIESVSGKAKVSDFRDNDEVIITNPIQNNH